MAAMPKKSVAVYQTIRILNIFPNRLHRELPAISLRDSFVRLAFRWQSNSQVFKTLVNKLLHFGDLFFI